MTGDWKTGPLPEVEGLYWCAGEDQGGYPCISAFRRTCRHATPFDPAHPMREIPLVWGYQRIDPGIGLSVSEWEKGDLPSRTIGWQRIEQPPHPCRDRWLTAEQRQARRISDEIEALLVEWYGLYWGALQCADIGDGSGADLAVYGLLASGLEYWGGERLMPDREFNHYFRDVRHLDGIDVYRVCELFGVTHPALQHAVKKLLVTGGRSGGKSFERDLRDVIASCQRALEMNQEDQAVKGGQG